MSSIFLHDLEVSVRPSCESKSIKLHVKNDARPIIRISPGYLSLALKNLLLNAVKHSAQGSQIDLTVRHEGDATEFIVRDYGEGVPVDSIPYIFDAFYRADTARNRAAGGAGIGLSLAQALVKLHGGTLMVESEVDKGATFVARIPIRQQVEEKSSKAKKAVAVIPACSPEYCR